MSVENSPPHIFHVDSYYNTLVLWVLQSEWIMGRTNNPRLSVFNLRLLVRPINHSD